MPGPIPLLFITSGSLVGPFLYLTVASNAIDQTILRGDQTPFIKPYRSMTEYEYTGNKSRITGIDRPLREFVAAYPVEREGLRQESGTYTLTSKSIRGSLVLKKSIRNRVKTEMWNDCRWNIDVHYQQEGRRDDPLNWELIERFAATRFITSESDDQTTYTRDDTGEVLLTTPWATRYNSRSLIARVMMKNISAQSVAPVTCFGVVTQKPAIIKRPGYYDNHIIIAGTDAILGNPSVGISYDAGATWAWTDLDGTNNTPTWTNAITGVAGKDNILIVVSEGEAAHAYSLDEGATWTEYTSASYTAHNPTAISMYSQTYTWICGQDGYVWASHDGGQTIDVVHPGIHTVQDLVHVRAYLDRLIYCVGTGNTILRFENGLWTLVPGPAALAGQQINSALWISSAIGLIGYNNGQVYWSEDKGANWQQDTQIDSLGLSEIMEIDGDWQERTYILARIGAEYSLYSNVHGCPEKWELVHAFIGVTLAAMIFCDMNEVVVGG